MEKNTLKKGLELIIVTGAMALSLLGCNGKNHPKYTDPITVTGKVVEVTKNYGGSDFLIKPETSGYQIIEGGKTITYSFPENRLYHFGTKSKRKFSEIKEGSTVRVTGQHGGECEEDFKFSNTFGDVRKGEYNGSMRAPVKIKGLEIEGNYSENVDDIIHGSIEWIGTEKIE